MKVNRKKHNKVEIMIEEYELNEFTFQMITNCKVCGLLDFKTTFLNLNPVFEYDTKGFKNMFEFLKQSGSEMNMIDFFKNIYDVLETSKKYFLDVDGFLLSSDMIYVDLKNLEPFFCYIPIKTDSLKSDDSSLKAGFEAGMLSLLEDVIKYMNIYDSKSVMFVNDLYAEMVDGGDYYIFSKYMEKELSERRGESSGSKEIKAVKNNSGREKKSLSAEQLSNTDFKGAYLANDFYRIPIPEGDSVVVGRGFVKKDKKYPVNYSSISRNHAEISYYNNHLKIKDLGSKNKTKVNDNFIKKKYEVELFNGDNIKFGNAEFNVVM